MDPSTVCTGLHDERFLIWTRALQACGEGHADHDPFAGSQQPALPRATRHEPCGRLRLEDHLRLPRRLPGSVCAEWGRGECVLCLWECVCVCVCVCV